MRQIVRDFVEACVDTLPLRDPVFEFGSLQVPGQEGFADLRPLFADREYVGADLREGPGVDRIMDAQKTDLPSDSVGVVLLLDTLEHVEAPREAIGEAHRILDSGGVLLLSTVMCFPIHDFPSDYWRFTPAGLRHLLQPFPTSLVGYCGERDFPHTVLGVGMKGDVAEERIQTLTERFRYWNRPHPEATWKDWLRPAIPPIVLDVYHKMRSRSGGE